MASAPPAQPQRRRGDAAPPLPAFDTAGQPAPPQPDAALAATMPDHACDAAAAAAPPPALQVYCFGQCRILQDGHPIEGWPQTKGKAIFKYLLLHRRHPVAKEVLMQTFWPDADPEGARNNLNVAIYGARKILARAQPAVTHILLQDGCYRLNPAVPTWTDVDRFLDCVMTGREQERLTQFEAARALYQEAEQLYREDLLVEDRLEEWLAPERMRLRDLMLDTLRRLVRINERAADLQACIATSRRLLEIDPCDEAVHRELMQFYCRRAQPHLALRQFQSCADALSRQLHMIPSPQTTALFRQIQRREAPGPALANGE
jgi:DNA-binding SARP family transcriptional activator